MRIKSTILFSLFVLFVIGLTNVASSNNAAVVRPVSPKQEATVSFSFDGLMAICFGNPERVSAGLLDVQHHTPEITINKISEGKKSTLAVLRGEQLRRTLYIDVEGASAGVSRYYGETMGDPNDFRWNIDLEGEIYQRQLYVNEE